MDQRQTFGNLAELKAILEEDGVVSHIAYLIIDRDGLTRISGHITGVEMTTDARSFIIIDSSPSHIVYLTEIVAINGLFRSDYSEC